MLTPPARKPGRYGERDAATHAARRRCSGRKQPIDQQRADARTESSSTTINRRSVLRGALSLGALTLLTGCDVTEEEPVQKRSARGVGMERPRAGARYSGPIIWRRHFRRRRWSSRRALTPITTVEDVKPVDGATWNSNWPAASTTNGRGRAQQIYALPEQEIIIRHICVEGWDYIGQWSGPNLKNFFQRVGADLTAKYVYFHCNDDYTESIDMATALHPQTILATRYANETITDPFGFPLRLRTATKLGYKNAKWISAIEVTNTFTETFWSKQGFNWFAGI